MSALRSPGKLRNGGLSGSHGISSLMSFPVAVLSMSFPFMDTPYEHSTFSFIFYHGNHYSSFKD
jgi:hypothetical protein